MKHLQLLQLTLMSAALAIAPAVFANLEPLDASFEDVTFVAHLDANGVGQLIVYPCDACAPVTLEVDTNSKVFALNEALDRNALSQVINPHATIVYDPATMKLKRVHF